MGKQISEVPTLDSTSSLSTGYQKATYPQLMELHYSGFTSVWTSSEDDRKYAQDLYPKILDKFESTYGKIQNEYRSLTQVSAVVLTESGYLDVVHNIGEGSEAEKLILESNHEANEVYRVLKDNDRYRCNEAYYSVIAYIIQYLEKQSESTSEMKENGASNQILAFIRLKYSQANIMFERTGQRMAKIEYFKGMIVGAILWVILTAILLAAMMKFGANLQASELWFLPLILTAGGTGAIVSVLSRMTFGRLILDYESGQKLLRLFGGFRVIIGAILGVALPVLIRGGLLPLEVPREPQKVIFFFAGVAFLAGFGERWAQDMLVTARKKVSAGSPQIKKN